MLPEGLPGGIHLPGFLKLRDQRQAFAPVCAFAKQEIDFFHGAGRQVDVQLDGGAWIQPGIDRARQPDPAKRRRAAQASQPAQKLCPVGCHAVRFFVGSQEGHTFAKFAVEMVGRQQGVLIGGKLRHDMRLLGFARGPHDPLGVIGNGDAARAFPQVLQAQMRNFHRRIRRGEQAQALVQPGALALKN